MRNIGIIIILAVFGVSLWKASERHQPVVDEPKISSTQRQLVQEDQPAVLAPALINAQAEEETPSLEEPDQIEVSDGPDVSGSGNLNLKTRQVAAPKSQEVNSYDQIVIPSLKINTPIVPKQYAELSWDLTALGQDVALLENIPNQTSGKNIVLAGHVTVRDGSNGPFRYLWKMEPGDTILLKKGDLTYTYSVREQVLVFPDDISVLEDSQSEQLTLITCTTWDEDTLSYLRRRVITADLESVEREQVLLD